MQNHKKLSFFQKMILSITDFRVYPYILKTEKLIKSFSYFICFILLIVTVITIRYSSDIIEFTGNFISEYNEIVPEFSLSDGILNIDEKNSIKINNDLVAIIDTDYKYEEYISTNDYREATRYDSRIFINSDAITYENYDGSGIRLLLKNVQTNYDKISLYEHISDMYNSSKGKISIFLTVYVSVFMTYGMLKFLEILLFAVFASLVSVLYRIKVEFKNYLKIAIYIVTLPYIIETISIVYTGSLKDYALLVSNILAYVYIFYAIRAIKLDAFLLIMNNKKVKSTSEINFSNDEDSSISDEDNVVSDEQNNTTEDNIDNEEEKKNDESNGG